MVVCDALLALALLAAPGDPVLLAFTSEQCEACRAAAASIGDVKSAGYRVQTIDVDRNSDLALRYRITRLPTFVMLVNDREVNRVVGNRGTDPLVKMFTAARFAEPHTIRGPTPAPPLARNVRPTRNVIDDALKASVRVRVEDAEGQSVGSGTVIDTQRGEALVVTCGHLFRDIAPQARIHVDLFGAPAEQTLAGNLISYDLNHDIAFVSIRAPASLAVARVASSSVPFQRGGEVFAIGCDHGAPPSVLQGNIKSVDRYQGPPNIEVNGVHASGRSGGGLFTADGLLIGVCNHSDPHEHSGLYASLPTVHWGLDRIGQQRIYQPAVQVATTGSPKSLTTINPPPPTPRRDNEHRQVVQPRDEVICIVRSRTDPTAPERVYVLDTPSSDLLLRLQQEGRVAHTVPPRRRMIPVPTPSSPIVRAQSRGN